MVAKDRYHIDEGENCSPCNDLTAKLLKIVFERFVGFHSPRHKLQSRSYSSGGL
jgi:hypothetical protein